MAGLIIFALIILFLLLWLIIIFNRLVSLKNEVQSAWSQIDVQLKRRYDLIPNLVSAVKGYMEFERDTLERVTLARINALSAVRLFDKAAVEEKLTQAVKSLFAVMENYPVLKSNENVLRLQEELTSTENRIAFARQFYNDLVANYITKLEIFPDNIIASMFSFKGAEYFKAENEDKELPSADVSIQTK